MRTVRAFGPRDLRVVDIPDPSPAYGEVVLAVRACGICGSDKWFWSVQEPTDYVAGHEVAGEVIVLGEGVTHLRVGDRVAVNNVHGCGHCDACRAGAYVRCTAPLTHMNHGFSEKVAVPERNCLLLDSSLSFEAGSLIFDLWGTPFGALERAHILPGEIVLVTGCGPIGLAAVVLLKHFGAFVVAVEPLKARRDAAKKLGADVVLAGDESSVLDIQTVTTGGGVSKVIECSGHPSAYQLAFAALSVGGTLVSVGEGALLNVDVSHTLIHRHLNWIGTLYSTMEQGSQVQQLMVKGVINPTAFVTDRFTLDDLPAQFGCVVDSAGGLLKSVVLVD